MRIANPKILLVRRFQNDRFRSTKNDTRYPHLPVEKLARVANSYVTSLAYPILDVSTYTYTYTYLRRYTRNRPT